MDNEELFVLIKNYLSGDDMSFTKFYNLTKNKVFANIYSYVKNEAMAEDILSEVYVKFIDNAKKIHKNQSILGFLYVISRNISINYLKKNKKNESLDNCYFNFSSEMKITNKLECEEIIQIMNKVLTNEMFNVVIMRLINEMEYSEISKLLNKKETTVRWIYAEAIKKVKEELYVREY